MFDDEGKVKKYTPAEVTELRGKKLGLPGYEAKLDDLKVGQTVKVTLTRVFPPKKDDTKKEDAKTDDAKKDDAKTDDAKKDTSTTAAKDTTTIAPKKDTSTTAAKDTTTIAPKKDKDSKDKPPAEKKIQAKTILILIDPPDTDSKDTKKKKKKDN